MRDRSKVTQGDRTDCFLARTGLPKDGEIMTELANHLAMGRYGAFVWPAYGLTALAFAWMVGQTVARLRARRREERDLAALARPRRVKGGNRS